MHDYQTLQEVIRERRNENDLGIRFINAENDETFVPYSQLYENALKILNYLQLQGIQKGNECILQIEDNSTFLNVFWACILGGIIPVPLTAGGNEQNMIKLKNITDILNKPYFITDKSILSKLKSFFGDDNDSKVNDLLANRTMLHEDIRSNDKGEIQSCTPDDIAFLQFSSGSTGDPKGVILKHKNLIANINGIIIALNLSDNDAMLSWMPLTHDMGMIGYHLTPIMYGINHGIMNTAAFIRRPLLWLDKASFNKYTVLSSPNFGYKYVLKFLKSDQQKNWDLSHVRLICNGAEPISTDLCNEFLNVMGHFGLPRTAMTTVYGLAEATVCVTFPPLEQEFETVYVDRHFLKTCEQVHFCSKEDPNAVSFVKEGTPILNSELRITGNNGEVLDEDIIGHIEIKGKNVTSGYYNNPTETKKKIRDDGWLNTGDLGFITKGQLVVTGREKDIIFSQGQNFYPHDLERIAEKVKGIELGTIAASGFFDSESNEDKIIMFVLYKKNDLEEFARISNDLKKVISVHTGLKISQVIPVKKILKTTSGKVQRYKLLEQFKDGKFDEIIAELAKHEKPATVQLEFDAFKQEKLKQKVMNSILSSLKEVAGYNITELDTGFAELGIQSIKVPKLQIMLEEAFGISIPISIIYDYPTINKLSEYIIQRIANTERADDYNKNSFTEQSAMKKEPIAVIGIGCRFPGNANNPEEFWENLINGIDAIDIIPENQRSFYDGYEQDKAKAEMATQYGGFLKDIDQFDPVFFGITPREVLYMDPQQRLLMEVCLEAFENAGINPDSQQKSTGVFIGVSNNEYIDNTTQKVEELEGYALTGSMVSSVAGRISYTFGFQGPSVSLDTACSSSLVAAHQAITSLHNQECEMAIAGGVNLIISPKAHIGFSRLNALSQDGRCKSFDDAANGYVRSEGCGIVILKPLSKAIRDNNRIYALITGSAVNHDGQSAGYTVPNGIAQEQVIQRALSEAGITAEMVDYIEAHGSGTKIGDSQEVNALAHVFEKRGNDNKLLIGTVKTNIGHCESAAGAAGLIKTVLAVANRRIPGNLNYKTPSRQIPWDKIPIKVVDKTMNWNQRNKALIAGVSSFGITGTNAHLIVQEAPAIQKGNSAQDRNFHVLTFSAKSKSALTAMMKQYQTYFQQDRENIGDVCYTSNISRVGYKYRFAAYGKSTQDFRQKINAILEGKLQLPDYSENGNGMDKLAFMFTGQGSVYQGAAQELFDKEPVFQAALYKCDKLFIEKTGRSVVGMLYLDKMLDQQSESIEYSVYAQICIFSIEYALGQLWLSWGVKPSLVFGHSIGEYAAACFAGVFSLEDAVELVSTRLKVMESISFKGKMAGVLANEAKVIEIIRDYPEVSIAAVNAAENVTISGPVEAMEQALARIKNERIFIENLNISHPFHSKGMEPYAEQFKHQIGKITFAKPTIPIISTIADTIDDNSKISSFDYWCKHIHKPVSFYEAVKKIADLGYNLYIEIGGTATLSGLVSQIVTSENAAFIPSLRKGRSAEEQLTIGLSQLYLHGVRANWEQFHQPFVRQRVSLPSYPFQRRSFWISKKNPTMSKADFQDHQQQKSWDIDKFEQTGNKIMLTDNAKELSTIKSVLKGIIYQITGLQNEDEIDEDSNMMSLGLDSLMLVQFRKKINNQYNLDISLNQFLVDLNTVSKIAAYISENTLTLNTPKLDISSNGECQSRVMECSSSHNPVEALVKQQLEIIQHDHQLFNQQLDAMQNYLRSGCTAQSGVQPIAQTAAVPFEKQSKQPEREPINLRSMKFEKENLTEEQKAFIGQFIQKHISRTKSSREYAERYRGTFSDWINSLNFRMDLKELNYPIVSARSEGSKFWDQDGNEYIDIALGYGVSFFGNRPPFIVEALNRQLTEGFELGPQSDLAGQVAEQISQLTGVERVSFCNTGSEAVMVALRIARTVTKRKKVVLFASSFHGNNDGVLAQTDEFGTFPVSPGVTDGAVNDVIVLEYGTQETIERIRAIGSELAAVLVEPVQSRRPNFQPVSFLKELRKITAEMGTVLIFDEIVNGFRIHPGGAQAYFGIRADMVTYGKIIGGGMPLGIVAGKKEYLDTVDGGYWNFGDSSFPNKEVTFFAGTFCKHPLTMAVANVILDRMVKEGPALQERVNALTKYFADNVNKYFEEESVPLKVNYFSSQFKFDMCVRNGQTISPLEMDLFFHLLIDRGVYTWERRICYFSTVHTYDDVGIILDAIKSSIKELRLNGFFNQPIQPGAYIGKEASASESSSPLLASAGEQTAFPLSYAQRWIFGLSQINEGEKTFHLSGAWLVQRKLDRQKVDLIFNELLKRHESLRTAFEIHEDGISQTVNSSVKLEVFQASITWEQREAFIHDFMQPYNLANPPLVRVCLAELPGDESLLVMDFHHIAADGYSINLFAEDFLRLYQGEMLPELKFTYRDYVQWELEYLNSSKFQEQEKYWLDRFSGMLPTLDLPLDFPRPAIRSYQGDTLALEVDYSTAGQLREFSKKSGCTLYMTLFTAYLILLHKLTNQEDIIVGTPLAARAEEKWENNVGMFTNTLVQRNKVNYYKGIDELLEEVKTNCLQGLANQEYPFNLLTEKVGVKGYNNRNPLFDTIFDYEITKYEFISGDVWFKALRFMQKTSLADLTVEVMDNGKSLNIYFIYDTELFRKETVNRWISYYQSILSQIMKISSGTVADIDILLESERTKVLYDFNSSKLDYPADQTFHRLFEQQALKTPDQIAVEYDDKKGFKSSLTYRQLNNKANLLGNHLRQMGVKPDSIVGIMLDRSPLMVIAVLGVLKAGGAFLPLDNKQPKERLEYIIESSSMQFIVTQNSQNNEIQFQCPTVKLDELLTNNVESSEELTPVNISRPTDLAYVIYTSGSTGKPKGVMVQHDNFVNAAYVWRHEYKLDKIEVNLLQMANFSFDVFCGDLARVLINGGKMVICPESTRLDWEELYRLINTQKITLFESTPPLIIPFVDYLIENQLHLEQLQLLIIGSDVCKKQDFIKVMKYVGDRTRVINSYGITEATIDSSYYEGDLKNMSIEGQVPIGKPLPNTIFYILDKNLKPQPIGVPGELYIGGTGVSRGYLNNAELTSSRFMPDIFKASDRIYKTGDMAKWLPDGNVDFLGRTDFQVKIRGFRIEIGEIEAALKEHPAINDVVIIINADKQIVAYLATDKPNSTDLAPDLLRAFLQKKLPDYMIPAAYVPLMEFPLSFNGKIDIKALPEADIKSVEDYKEPRTPLEKGLVELWRDVLFKGQSDKKIGINDNFFNLGGDSLKIAMLAARINRKFNTEVPIVHIFTHPTIAGISEYINNCGNKCNYTPPVPALKREHYPLSPAQQRMFTLNKFDPSSIGYNIPFALLIQGALDRLHLEEVLKELILRHESLRTSFAEVNEQPVQIVHENLDFNMEYEVCSLKDNVGNFSESQINRFIQKFIRPFDLTRGPLFRAKLIKLTDSLKIENKQLVMKEVCQSNDTEAEVHLLLVDWHHIIADGISIKIFFEEFLRLYAGEKLSETSIHYKDYAVWFHDYLRKHERLQLQEAYWLNRFAGQIPKFSLPYDDIPEDEKVFSGSVYYFETDQELRDQLHKLCKESNVTLYMVLLAAYYLLLYKHTGQEDIIIGSPVAGRPLEDFHNVIGMFINMLAIRNFPKEDSTIRNFAMEVKESVIEALENQDYQFDELVNKLNLPKDFDRNSLFDAVFVLQNTQSVAIDSSSNGLQFMLYDFETNRAVFDLNLEAEDADERIKFALWYKTQLFRRETIEAFARDYTSILKQITKKTDQTIGEIIQFDQKQLNTYPIEDGDFNF